MAQWLKRIWTAIPIAVRPLLVFAIVPILAHQLFIGAPSTTKATKLPEIPENEELIHRITANDRFRTYVKTVRCFTRSNLELTIDTNPTVPVCRALLALGYFDPNTQQMTQESRRTLEYASYRDGDYVYVRIARPQIGAIVNVIPPPDEAKTESLRVEFTWSWKEMNPVGARLGISQHVEGMRGVASLRPIDSGWYVTNVELTDASPGYH